MIRPLSACLTLCVALLVSACAAFDGAKPPLVSLADIKFIKGGLLEQQIEVDLPQIGTSGPFAFHRCIFLSCRLSRRAKPTYATGSQWIART